MTFLLDHLIAGQAILFYIPRCIWLGMEGGMMEFLVTGCTGRVVESAGEKQRLDHNYVRYASLWCATESWSCKEAAQLVLAFQSVYK